jgi:hypothetical protein
MSYTIEMRENNGGTYILLIQDNKVASMWSCEDEAVESFVLDADPADWDDQQRYNDPARDVGDPESIGELLATRQSDGKLVIHDAERYAERLAFFGVQS